MKRLVILGFFCLFFSLQCQAQEQKKVALLFLTVADVSHPELWESLLTPHMDKFSIYVHNKESMKNPFFSAHRIAKRVPTTWANHVLAWRALIREALKDERNDKFVYLSDSCVPLRQLEEIYSKLIPHKRSFMNYWPCYWKESSGRVVTKLPPKHRWINSEWVILTRSHAQLIADDKQVINICDSYIHSSESYPSSLFSFFDQMQKKHIINKQTTYVDFLRGRHSHPYTFKRPSSKNLAAFRKAREDGCFFIRKVGKEFPDSVLLSIIDNEPIQDKADG